MRGDGEVSRWTGNRAELDMRGADISGKNFDVWREVARKFGSRSWSGCLREIQHMVIINIERRGKKKRSDEV